MSGFVVRLPGRWQPCPLACQNGGDRFERRWQEQAVRQRAQQRTKWSVSPQCALKTGDGRLLQAGSPVTLRDLEGTRDPLDPRRTLSPFALMTAHVQHGRILQRSDLAESVESDEPDPPLPRAA